MYTRLPEICPQVEELQAKKSSVQTFRVQINSMGCIGKDGEIYGTRGLYVRVTRFIVLCEEIILLLGCNVGPCNQLVLSQSVLGTSVYSWEYVLFLIQ